MKNNDPFVSVIVPLYNYNYFIIDCIQSILNQTYKNFELIVIDDCSTDSSYKKAKKFEKKDKKVIVIKLDKNYGYSKAKNEGIIVSKGEYIVTLDADDIMTKNSLEIRVEAALKYKVDFIYADAILFYEKMKLKKVYELDINKLKKKRSVCALYNPSLNVYNIHAQTVMIHRNIFKKFGMFDESLRSRSDREMWWRLFGKNIKDEIKVPYYYLNEIVAYYRYHKNSMWRKRKKNKKLDSIIIEKSENAYKKRKIEGINEKNTRFLKD